MTTAERNYRHSTELSCSMEEYVKFFVTSEELYSGYEPWLFIRVSPLENLDELLKKIVPGNPLGVDSQNMVKPSISPEDWDRLLQELKSSAVYQEYSDPEGRIGLKVEVRGYLKRHGLEESYSNYELFELRLLGLISLAYCLYLEDLDKAVSEMIVTKEERDKTVEAAELVREGLAKGLFMRNEQRERQLNKLLREFTKMNGAESGVVLHAEKDTNRPDHAMKFMAVKLVVLFKTINKDTNTKLIKAILSFARPSLSSTTADGFIRAAKDLIFAQGSLKEFFVGEMYPERERWRVFHRQGPEAMASLVDQKSSAYRRYLDRQK